MICDTGPDGPLFPEFSYPVDRLPTVDPELVTRRVLAGYLERLTFRVAPLPGSGGQVHEFRLNAVTTDWPAYDQELDYPSASVVSAGAPDYGTAAFVPYPIVESRDVYRVDTVLWKTGELQQNLQVDFWCSGKPEREAVAAMIHVAMNPSEERSGILMWSGTDYYRQPIHYMVNQVSRQDTGVSVYANEHRLRVSVRAEIPVVHLRQVRGLEPRNGTEVS